MTTPNNESYHSCYDWIKILCSRRNVLFFSVAVALLSGLIFTLISPPLYRATASLYFPIDNRAMLGSTFSGKADLDQVDVGNILMGSAPQPSIQNYAVAILKSRTMTDAVLDKYGQGIFQERFKRRKRVQLRLMLEKYVKVMAGADGIINITVETGDPALSADVVQFYIDSFNEVSRTAVLTSAKNKRIHLSRQAGIISKNLQGDEKKMAFFEESKKVVDMDSDVRLTVENYNQLLMMKAKADSQEKMAGEKLSALRELLEKQAKEFDRGNDYPSIKDDPVVRELQMKLSEKELELIQARQIYTDLHPTVKKLNEETAELKGFIRKKIGDYMSNLKSNLIPSLIQAETEQLALKAQSSAIQSLIEKKEKQMEKLPGTKMKYKQLKRSVENSELMLFMVEQELEKARVEESREDSEVQVLDPPVAPDRPSKPDWAYNMFVSLILGMILGITAVFYADYTEKAVRFNTVETGKAP